METRTFTKTQVRVYKLCLNRMTYDKVEQYDIVAISTDYHKLVDWYNSQLAPERWRDDRWNKTFMKDSLLEWYNPARSLELNDTYPFGKGISDEWVSDTCWNDLYQNRRIFIVEE